MEVHHNLPVVFHLYFAPRNCPEEHHNPHHHWQFAVDEECFHNYLSFARKKMGIQVRLKEGVFGKDVVLLRRCCWQVEAAVKKVASDVQRELIHNLHFLEVVESPSCHLSAASEIVSSEFLCNLNFEEVLLAEIVLVQESNHSCLLGFVGWFDWVLVVVEKESLVFVRTVRFRLAWEVNYQ